MSSIAFQAVPQDVSATDDYLRRLSTVALNIQNGKLNNIGSITLETGTSTVVPNQRVGGRSVIIFMPINANASSELYSGNMYVSSRGRQTFTITHAAGASDREFMYVVFG